MATNGLNLQANGLKLSTGTVERQFITSAGDFGFNTLTPSTDFHFKGVSGGTTGFRIESLGASSSNTNFLVSDANGVLETRNDIAVGTVVTGVTEASNVVTVAYNDTGDTSFTIDALTNMSYDSSWGLTGSGTGTVNGTFELPFITSGTYNAGTITLAINAGLESDITITGLDVGTMSSWKIGSTSGTDQDVSDGETVDIVGGTGISGVIGGTRTVTLTLDDTSVTTGSYGAANTVATFDVDDQGRLTAASDVSIDITASQVSDFTAASETAIFTTANFVDTTGASGINFTVVNGASVSGVLVNSSINTAGTTGTGSVDLGGTITYSSSDSSVVIADNGSGTFDLTVNAASVSDSYVTGGTVSGQNLTLTVSNGKPNVVVSGFRFNLSAQSGISNIVDMGNTIILNGGTGISSVGSASDTVTFNLDNTTVTAASYGAANTVATFDVDAQGRLTAAADVGIIITSSEVSDFTAASETAIFTTANFVDSSELNFTVSAGASVTAALIDGSIANARLVNDSLTFAGTAGTDSEVDLGGTLTFSSSDGSAIITSTAGTDTIDITIDGSVTSQNIYTDDGTLAADRTVTQSGNALTFTGGDVQLGGGVFHYDRINTNVGIGTSTPVVSAKLEVSSTTQGFLFPRMTSAQRTGIGSPATGLMVYQTDAEEGVYINKSFGWVQVI